MHESKLPYFYKMFHENSIIFSEFDTPVKITVVIYPVCLPKVLIDPKHLTGELIYELCDNYVPQR